jgi:hypothetical protein
MNPALFICTVRSEVSFRSDMQFCFKQLYRQIIDFCERKFIRAFDLQKGFSLSEAVDDGAGKEMVWV